MAAKKGFLYFRFGKRIAKGKLVEGLTKRDIEK